MDPIAWFARHPVASNLIMVGVLVGGLFSVVGIPIDKLPEALQKPGIRQEVFPEFSMDLISIRVPYLGAAPEEVEQGVCVRVEEAIQGLDGVDKITSTASEGAGQVMVELTTDADVRRVLDEIKSRVDAIDTFPEETEKPIVTEVTNRRQVVDVAIFGEIDDRALRHLADQLRDDLTALPGITIVELTNARPFEISIEVSEDALRRHGLTFDAVATAVRRSSLDLPGGSVKTSGGEILLRTKGQAYRGREFEKLALLTRPDGTHLRLGDVARVVDGFAETDQYTRLDGEPAMLVQVFRVGDQDALDIADKVKTHVAAARPKLPEGVSLATWNDASRILRDRRDLLVRNGLAGLALVFGALAIFLRFRLAVWVAVGLAIAFVGTLWLMPALGVSINVISLFAFILVLGIVVDDAIVVGENIYTHQHRSGQGVEGAISGAREVSRPVIFAVLTTIAAFTPLLNVTGSIGNIMRVIPLIVIPCLLWSLVESLCVLPAHLSHYKGKPKDRSTRHPFRWLQSRFAEGLDWVIRRVYRPVLEWGLSWRYVTLAVALSILLITAGLVLGGRIQFLFFPDVESDFISAALTLEPGSPVEATSQAVRRLEEAADRAGRKILDETGADVMLHMVAAIGEHPFRRAQAQNGGIASAQQVFSNLGEVTIELEPAETRNVSAGDVVIAWREMAGEIPGAVELAFTASLFSAGADINVQLTGPEIDDLRLAAEAVKERLAGYTGVYEISDSFRAGKREIKLNIKPAAEVVGLTLADLGRQVRQAFYGEEAQRIQRGRDDIRVMVRYPESERRSLADLEKMWIRTPAGGQVPFSEVAVVETGRGFATITRIDRRRAVNVTADVDPAQATPGDIIADLEANVLPEVLADFPRVTYTFEGQQAEQRKTIMGLVRGFVLALVIIYALLAIPLRSWAQPVIIMSAIPFGLVGAVWGHAMMGMSMTILSMFGIVALTGVVVNDSLVMVDFINRHRERGDSGGVMYAVRNAGVARFRAILLTSVTTFAGLSPLMLEKSMQARFLIPMAISLAYGVIFATVISLVLVPAGYLVMIDLQGLLRRMRGGAARLAGGDDDTPQQAIGDA